MVQNQYGAICIVHLNNKKSLFNSSWFIERLKILVITIFYIYRNYIKNNATRNKKTQM